MEILWMLFSAFLAGNAFVEATDLILRGKEGENITFTSTHSFADGNVKFFCRGEDCSYEDALITSEGPNTAKYHITDRGDDFDVTIYDLEGKDSGTYWCGIKRAALVPNTHNRVELAVDPQSEGDENEHEEETDTSEENKEQTTTTANENDATDGVKEGSAGEEVTPPSSKTLVYVGAGLGLCLGVLVLLVLLFFFQRRRHVRASSANTDGKTDHGSINSPEEEAVIYTPVTASRGFHAPGDDALYCNVPSTQATSRAAPPSDHVTYSVVRGAAAD